MGEAIMATQGMVATGTDTEESVLLRLRLRPLPSQRLMLRLIPTTMEDMDSHTMAVTATGPTVMPHTLMAVTTEESVPLMPSLDTDTVMDMATHTGMATVDTAATDTDTTVRLPFNDRSIRCCHNHSIQDCGQQ